MFKRIGTVCLVATLLLSLVAGSCVADSWGSLGWSDNWKAQCGIPLPSGYESWHWLGGCDFGEVRGSRMWTMKAFRLAGDCSLAGLAAYMVGVIWGHAWALKGAQQAALAKTSLICAVLGGPALGSGLSFGGHSYSEWIAGLITPCPSVEALEKQIRDLRFKAGMSDYYSFGRALPPRYNRPPIGPIDEIVDLYGATVIVPFGARMKLRLGSIRDYYNLGYPAGEFRIISYDAWPRVIRLMTPTLDFGKFDARVWEMDIVGKLQPTTVKCVFPYEVIGGKAFPLPTKGNSPGLSVKPHTPQKGGKIVGKVRLGYRKKLGVTGLREVHVCSPVNQGVLSKKIDHHAFAIVINKMTVPVTPSKKELRVGDELVVAVTVKGFHPAKGSIRGSDGKTYPWSDWVGAILRGASLQGAGITKTELVHERERTLLKATVKEPGKVKAVLQTRDGPVAWEVATVEKKRSMINSGSISFKFVGYWLSDDGKKVGEMNYWILIGGDGSLSSTGEFKGSMGYSSEVVNTLMYPGRSDEPYHRKGNITIQTANNASRVTSFNASWTDKFADGKYTYEVSCHKILELTHESRPGDPGPYLGYRISGKDACNCIKNAIKKARIDGPGVHAKLVVDCGADSVSAEYPKLSVALSISSSKK